MDIRQPLLAPLLANPMSVKPRLSLMTIPGEIRNRIYDHLLLLEHVNVFYCDACCSTCSEHESRPDLAILQVNRQVNKEASALLYSTGTFVISTGRDLACFMSKTNDFCLYTPSRETFPSRAAIRSLEIRFVADYIPTDFHEERMKELWHSPDFRSETRRKRAKHLHDLDRTASVAVWGVAGELLCMMHGLKNLTVNVEQAFCPEGCCRLVDVIARSLRRLQQKPELKITIEGSLDNVELEAITDALRYREALDTPTESSSEEGDETSGDGSDSHSEDSTTSDGSDGHEDSSNGEDSDNSSHVSHGHDGTAGEQTAEDSGELGSSDKEQDIAHAVSKKEKEQRAAVNGADRRGGA